MSPPAPKRSPAPPASTRAAELENSRLGVIFFLGNLEVDFTPEKSSSDFKTKALEALKDKAGSKVSQAVAGIASVEGGESMVEGICKTVKDWVTKKFHVSPSDADLAIQHIRYNLPALISDIKDELTKTGSDFGLSGVASGLYTGITKAIESRHLTNLSQGVIMSAGHPEMIARSIRESVWRSCLIGLGQAALEGAKAALAAFTGGVGLIINKLAGVIEAILKFAVRFCDGLGLRRIFAECKEKWAIHGQDNAIQKDPVKFAKWFQKTIDRSPVVAALVMNCGIAGDAMRFLQVVTSEDTVMTQGQFDAGVNYLTALKSSASDLILKIQEDMKISSHQKLCAAMLQHAGEIGMIQKESGSSWRAWLYSRTHQTSKKSQALNWLLNKVGYKQSTLHG